MVAFHFCEEQNFSFMLAEVVQIFTYLDLNFLCAYDPVSCPVSWEHFKISSNYAKGKICVND